MILILALDVAITICWPTILDLVLIWVHQFVFDPVFNQNARRVYIRSSEPGNCVLGLLQVSALASPSPATGRSCRDSRSRHGICLTRCCEENREHGRRRSWTKLEWTYSKASDRINREETIDLGTVKEEQVYDPAV